MAPTHLPRDLFQQQQQQQPEGADSGGFKMPFIANLYVKVRHNIHNSYNIYLKIYA